ncbi:hypothetical protein ECB94_13190 [Vibrio mediterranei]|uniref:Uncharacterized protein n=1 Tax=Vibrio mediterranei TaxID=689 RepID=A0A3G4VGL7_9VIBR|nr:hypothetical protein ECB94_13190 [Vibrio mediterranei]
MRPNNRLQQLKYKLSKRFYTPPSQALFKAVQYAAYRQDGGHNLSSRFVVFAIQRLCKKKI